MPRTFYSATAEQLISVIEAVILNNKQTEIIFVENFCEVSEHIARSALDLAVDIGFLKEENCSYSTNNFLCRMLITHLEDQKAAILRIQLESYEPFTKFRDRLMSTHNPEIAAKNIKTIFDFDSTWQGIRDTLISLGTYSHALDSRGAGVYLPSIESFEDYLFLAVAGCQELINAEQTIKQLIGQNFYPDLPFDEIIKPLSQAMVYASKKEQPRNVILHAGNAIDDFLNYFGDRVGLDVRNKTGINSKLDDLSHHGKLAKKLVYMGKYLGNIRNAADHGSDPEIRNQWAIRKQTSVEYVFVACTFIYDCLTFLDGHSFEL